MNTTDNNYNFKSLVKDRSLLWRYTWAIIVPLVTMIFICMSIGAPLDNITQNSNNLANTIHNKNPEKYAFIDNNAIPPFYKEKLSNDKDFQYISLDIDNWTEIAKKDSINYVLEFKDHKENSYSIDIWTNEAKEYDALRDKIQSLEFEKAGIPLIEINKRRLDTDANVEFGLVYNYIGYGLNSIICFFVLFFAFWCSRYIAIDAVQGGGNNSYDKTLFYIFIAQMIAILLVLLSSYRAAHISYNNSAMIASNYVKAFISFKYIGIMSVLSAIVAFILSNIWALHNFSLKNNLYRNMRNGNKYYILLVYLATIGIVGSLLNNGFIIVPILNLFTIGKLLITDNATSIDIIIFLASNFILGFLLLFWGKKKANQLIN